MRKRFKGYTGGAAFPRQESVGWPGEDGMTLRDYFAAKALAGYLAVDCDPTSCREDQCRIIEQQAGVIVRMAWVVADAMLKARNT